MDDIKVSFAQKKSAFIAALKKHLKAPEGATFVDALVETDIEFCDLNHAAMEESLMDCGNPVDCDAMAAALTELIWGSPGDPEIEYESIGCELHGDLIFQAHVDMQDAAVQWALEKYGEEAADEIFNALDDFETKTALVRRKYSDMEAGDKKA